MVLTEQELELIQKVARVGRYSVALLNDNHAIAESLATRGYLKNDGSNVLLNTFVYYYTSTEHGLIVAELATRNKALQKKVNWLELLADDQTKEAQRLSQEALALQARAKKLEAALQPFADEKDIPTDESKTWIVDIYSPESNTPTYYLNVTVADFHRAATVLNTEPEKKS